VEKGALGRLLGDLAGCLMAGGVRREDATLWRIEGNSESASTGDFNVWHLGIDTHITFPNHAGRAMPILPDGETIRELA
jgi:hypothetical protein